MTKMSVKFDKSQANFQRPAINSKGLVYFHAESHAPNSDEILKLLGRRTEDILMFTDLYDAFSGFVHDQDDKTFLAKCTEGLTESDYRQSDTL